MVSSNHNVMKLDADVIGAQMQQYESLLAASLDRGGGLLRTALSHISQRMGKQMRPRLMLLCAEACGGVTPAVLHAAVAIEMLHTASLVHDDVVDDSPCRRGQPSVGALIGGKAAVLVGDYLLATALDHASQTGDIRAVQRLAWLGSQLAEGELMQIDMTHDQQVEEAAYREVIRRKTASLFAVSAELGATLAARPHIGCEDGAETFDATTAYRLGEAVGMAFQMRDDMFDYYDSLAVGKPTAGADLREGKLTLPAIHAVLTDTSLMPLALKVRAGEASAEEIDGLRQQAVRLGMDYTRQAIDAELQTAMAKASLTAETVRAALCEYIRQVAARTS